MPRRAEHRRLQEEKIAQTKSECLRHSDFDFRIRTMVSQESQMSAETKNNFPKLHNAAWPGVVGKGSEGGEPFIDLDTMLNLTAAASVNGTKFDGVDLFLFAPHVDIDSTEDDLKRLADK